MPPGVYKHSKKQRILEPSSKKCIECNEVKDINEFYKNSFCVIDGYRNICKLCIQENRKEYQQENKEKVREQQRLQRIKNAEKIKIRDKEYSQTKRGKEVRRRARQKWALNNPDKDKESKRKYSNNNLDKKKEYYLKNKDNIIKHNLEVRRNSPHKKLRHNIGNIILIRLKNRHIFKNRKASFDFLPYTVEELAIHIESLWKNGMNWDNYGKLWHIDHIIPDCSFHYTSMEDEEFQKCWALSNLQPLWAEENYKKNKY